MPRSNRPRRGRVRDAEAEPIDLTRALAGRARVETHRDRFWNVQPIAASSSAKQYLCPGCGLGIAPGAAHLATWRADGLMGAADDLAARRHWHTHCWRVR